MKLSDEQVKEIAFGFLRVSKDPDGYFRFLRMTENQMANLSLEGRHPDGGTKERHGNWTAGMKLSLDGGITRIAFDFKIDQKFRTGWPMVYDMFQIYVDGASWDVGSPSLGKDFEGRYDLSFREAKHHIDVYFPTYSTMLIRNVEISGEYRPHVFRKKLLAIGDSITHGMAHVLPGDCYLNRFARELDFEVLSQAVSGDRFGDLPIDPICYEPDVILIAFGTNDWAWGKPVYENASACFKRLNELFPAAKKFAITPIARLRRLNELFDEKTFKLHGYTLPEYRKLIRKAAEENNVTVCDGSPLVPAKERYFTDGLHPNMFGHYQYALNLIEWYRGNFLE